MSDLETSRQKHITLLEMVAREAALKERARLWKLAQAHRTHVFVRNSDVGKWEAFPWDTLAAMLSG